MSALQLNLLRSHACGVGEPFPVEVVRAAMLLRANALAKGTSGVRLDTVQLLLECSPPAFTRSSRRGVAGRLRRPGAACPPRPGAGRRGPGERGRGCARGRGAGRGRFAPARAGRQGGTGADQRHAVHGRHRRARPGPWPAPGGGGRPCGGADDRGRARLADAVCPRAPGAAAAPGPDRVARRTSSGCSTTPRSSPRTAGAAGCRTPTRCAARRRCTARCATRWTTPSGWWRSS